MFVNKKSLAGFTLIEIMVAVSIFSIVAVIAVGALLTANTVNQKAQATKLIMDNLNFAMDSMVFKMRKSGAYYCENDFTSFLPPESYANGKDCLDQNNPGKAIVLTDRSDPGRLYAYFFKVLADGRGIIKFLDNKFGNTENEAITLVAGAIDIDDFRFYVSESPFRRVLISLFGTASIGRGISEFALETVVNERR